MTQEMAQVDIDKAVEEADVLRQENKSLKADLRKSRALVDKLELSLEEREEQILKLQEATQKVFMVCCSQ